MYGEYTRNRILALANAYKTPTEIVGILREENIIIVRTTVARIKRRTREKMQGQQRPDRRGRPRKATSPVKRKIDEDYRRDPEINASELKNVLENELPGIRIGVSTIKRARKAAGWICTQTRYCQMVRDANKIKRLEFCRKIIETNDDFSNVIFTEESSVEIERATTIRFHKQGEMYKPASKPKHPLKVHVWGGISKHGPMELVILRHYGRCALLPDTRNIASSFHQKQAACAQIPAGQRSEAYFTVREAVLHRQQCKLVGNTARKSGFKPYRTVVA